MQGANHSDTEWYREDLQRRSAPGGPVFSRYLQVERVYIPKLMTLALPQPIGSSFSFNTKSRDSLWVLLLCVAQVLLWSCAFGLYKAPELDSAEQLVWSFSLENGYWKHPPIPSWIMHGLISVLGPSVLMPFIATQFSIVIALALMWRLGCEFMSSRKSLVAMILTSLIAYHNIGADCFNHNTALLPFQAAALLLFYRATRTGQWWLWGLTGLFAGMAMLVKYVAIWPLLGLALYFALDRRLHHKQNFLGLILALGIFLATLTPHLLWLYQTDFLPFRYAKSIAHPLPGLINTFKDVGMFLVIQMLRLVPFALGTWFVFRRKVITRSEESIPPLVNSKTSSALPLNRSDRLFLWISAFTPLLCTTLFSLATETDMPSRWGANAFLLSGWLIVAYAKRFDDELSFSRALRFAVVAHFLLCLGMTVSKTVLAEHLHIRTRANYPGAVLAHKAYKTWQAYTHAPLRIVISNVWLGGNIVAHSGQRVAVLTDGYHLRAPWVSESAIQQCGALVLDDRPDDTIRQKLPNPALDTAMHRANFSGSWILPWPTVNTDTANNTESDHVRWGIIMPADAAHCELSLLH